MSQLHHASDVREVPGRHAAATGPRRVSGYALAVSAITALTGVLGLVRLDEDGLWRDETFSAYIATRPFGHAWSIIVDRELNMGLYYLLLWAWAHVSSADAWLRSLSVVMAVATVPVMAAVARRLLGPQVALLTALLLALSPFFAFYSRFARTYALTTFLAVASTWLLLRAWGRPGARWWVGYVAVSVLLVCSSPLALMMVAAQAVALVAVRRSGGGWRPLLVVYGAIGLLAAPVVLRLVLAQSGMTGWIPLLSVSELAGIAADVAGAPWLVPVYLVAAVAWLAGVVRRSPAASAHPLTVPLVTSWLVLPLAALTAVSIVKPLLIGRYVAFVVPVLVLVLAWAVTRIPWRGVAAAALAVLVLVDVASLVERVYLRSTPDPVRAVAEDIAAQAQPGDVVLYGPAHVRLPVAWYLTGEAEEGEVVPEDVAVLRSAEAERDEFPLEYAAEALVDRVEDAPRTWVVSLPGDEWHPTPEPGLEAIASVRADDRLVYEHEYATLLLQLYTAAP